MTTRAFIIVGQPGSGKSLPLHLVRSKAIAGLKAVILSKETTRRPRTDEGSEIAIAKKQTTIELRPTKRLREFAEKHPMYYDWNHEKGELTLTGPIPYEEVQQLLGAISNRRDDKFSVEKLQREANVISDRCDVVYEQYSRRYGFPSRSVLTALNRGNSVVGIVNDLRAIRELKSILGQLVVVLFLYRGEQRIESLQRKRGAFGSDGLVDEIEIELRKDKARVILRRYIDNIELFDHVILNTEDDPDDLRLQMEQIAAHYADADLVKFRASEGLYA